MRGFDLFGEAVAGVLQRPARAVLTGLGTALGVGTFVTVLGLTTTAGAQISGRFDAFRTTEVVVEDTAVDPYAAGTAFPAEAVARVRGIEGVVNAGVFWTAAQRPVRPAPETPGEEYPIVAVTPGALAAMRPVLAEGRWFDEFHERQDARVAMLASGVARRLGIERIEEQPAIFIDGVPLSVIGIYQDVQRRAADVLLSVLVPSGTAEALFGPPTGSPSWMLVETRPGAAEVVAGQLPVAVSPHEPGRYRVQAPPDPRALAEGVSADLQVLFFGLAGVCLIIGTVGIANTTLVAVLERVGEFGLRRTVGARRRHIYAQVLAESGMLGTFGGVLGVCVGVLVVVAVAIARTWTAVIDAWVITAAPVAGLAAGLVAGLYPAWRATRVEPVEALRS